MSDFHKYFKENMESLGLPAPETLFGSLGLAVGTATTLLTQMEKFGKTVTVGELIGGGSRLACSSAFYVGAVIGSIALATGRVLGNGTSLGDVLASATRHRLNTPWLAQCMYTHPGIYQSDIPRRTQYRLNRSFA